MSLDSQRIVFIFHSWFDLLDVVVAIPIFILKIFKSLRNYLHGMTDITIFGKRLESSSGHMRNVCPNLVIYHFKNLFQQESPTRSSTVK